jgi:membrane fusion protein, heavy metal efflux system
MLGTDIHRPGGNRRRSRIAATTVATGVVLFTFAGQAQAAGAQARRVEVTQEQVERLGIKTSRASRGAVSREVRVPGEIAINSKRVVRVTPRAAGIVREVKKVLGERVQIGETLAWVESEELAEAKLGFCAKEVELRRAEIRLPQIKAIFENTAKLIALLRNGAEEEELGKLGGLEMGTYRGQLLPAYAAYLAARTTHEREANPPTKGTSDGSGLLDAKRALEQARTGLYATMDTARYETLAAYARATQERQLAAFSAVAAEKRLRLKGADDETVAALRALAPTGGDLDPILRDGLGRVDAKLPSVGDALRSDKRFAWYALRASAEGTLMDKQIVVGESLGKAAEALTIADLSSVWVDLAISQDVIPSVEKGLAVTIYLADGSRLETKIAFVSPLVAPDTRTASARATLPNPDGRLRPGTFVDAGIWVPSEGESIVVPKASVQLVSDRPCVFVWANAGFELREVLTGSTDGQRIEILQGLRDGETVASVNAFHLKAELAKSAGGGVGGHGHAH